MVIIHIVVSPLNLNINVCVYRKTGSLLWIAGICAPNTFNEWYLYLYNCNTFIDVISIKWLILIFLTHSYDNVSSIDMHIIYDS